MPYLLLFCLEVKTITLPNPRYETFASLLTLWTPKCHNVPGNNKIYVGEKGVGRRVNPFCVCMRTGRGVVLNGQLSMCVIYMNAV